MVTYRFDQGFYAQRLIYEIVFAGGTSVSLEALVSRWMALHFSAQTLFTQFELMVSQGGLALVHDLEGTRVRLADGPLVRRQAHRRSEHLSDGETVEFATAVSRVYELSGAAPPSRAGIALNLRTEHRSIAFP